MVKKLYALNAQRERRLTEKRDAGLPKREGNSVFDTAPREAETTQTREAGETRGADAKDWKGMPWPVSCDDSLALGEESWGRSGLSGSRQRYGDGPTLLEVERGEANGDGSRRSRIRNTPSSSGGGRRGPQFAIVRHAHWERRVRII